MALLPPFFLDCVVAIGIAGTNHLTAWIGTGFFYGFPNGKNSEGQTLFTVYLVTNQHVIKDHKQVCIRLNPQDGQPAREFPLVVVEPNGRKGWFGHNDASIDLAVFPINGNFLRSQGMRFAFFEDQTHLATKASLRDGGLAEGDPVFVLGFPMGHVGNSRLYAICRQGVVARCRDWLEADGKEFLVDSAVFPGNSGGPVISSIYFSAIQGTKAHNRSDLIGVVQSYLPYQDVAISQQTRRPRISFEENSGLASVIPVDFLREIVVPLHKQIELPMPPGASETPTEPPLPPAVTPASMRT